MIVVYFERQRAESEVGFRKGAIVMTGSANGNFGVGTNGRSPAERQKLLAELRKQLPPAGSIFERGGSPEERMIVLLVEFLRCMLAGKSASFDILTGKRAYLGRSYNYVGLWCKKIGLQWMRVGGKKVYPATGANMLKLCDELNHVAPDELAKIAADAGMTVDELIDFACEKFHEESFEDRDEFVDLPEDFQLSDCIGCDPVAAHIEGMLRQFKDPQAASDESPVPPHSNDSDSDSESREESIDSPNDTSTRGDRGADFDPEQFQSFLRGIDASMESVAEPPVGPQPDDINHESFGERLPQPEQDAEQSPE